MINLPSLRSFFKVIFSDNCVYKNRGLKAANGIPYLNELNLAIPRVVFISNFVESIHMTDFVSRYGKEKYVPKFFRFDFFFNILKFAKVCPRKFSKFIHSRKFILAKISMMLDSRKFIPRKFIPLK